MLRTSLAAVAMGLLIGCSSGNIESPTASGDMNRQAQLAAFAASSKYPTTQASNEMAMGALVSRSDNTIRIVNFTNQPLQDVKVWINGTFVHQVASIPPHGIVRLAPANFYDSTGRSLSATQTSPNSIQVESGSNLYNLQGPIFE